MRMIMLLGIAVILSVNIALGSVVINEVYYDAVGTESGGEFIELYNDGAAVDISGWLISTEISASDAVIPDGTILGTKQYYLIADAGWEAAKDDSSWPQADLYEALTMANSDSGVALKNGSTIIDAVGWGDSAGIEAGLYEGEPATDVNAGSSLQRNADTGNNIDDFSGGTPSPKNSSSLYSSSNESYIAVTVDVGSVDSFITSITIQDDSDEAGAQVMPFPGQLTIFAVMADVSGNVSNVTAEINGTFFALSNLGNGTYAGNASLNYTEPPGNKTLTIHAGAFQSSASFEYVAVSAIEVDSSSLAFPALLPGGQSDVSGDVDFLTKESPTVRNIGNVPVSVGIGGTPLVSSSGSIGISNLFYSFGNGGLSPLSSGTEEAGTLSPGQSAALGLRLQVPSSTPEGSYSGAVIVAVVG